MVANKVKSEIVVHESEVVEVALPASAASEDEKLVDGVVEKIQTILADTLVRGMDEVGKLLLREFFEDNPALYTSTSHAKHASLRLLLKRCETMDLPVRRTFLANSLQMAVFTRGLPENATFSSLPPSHRVELMRLGSPDRAEVIAVTAVEKKMTVQRIREVVRNEREKNKSTRGRKPIPPVFRTVSHALRTLNNQETGRLLFRRDDVEQLNDDQRAELKSMIESLSKRLEQLGKLVG